MIKNRWQALYSLPAAGIEWRKRTLGKYLANIPGETAGRASMLKWAANVFLKGKAKDRKFMLMALCRHRQQVERAEGAPPPMPQATSGVLQRLGDLPDILWSSVILYL